MAFGEGKGVSVKDLEGRLRRPRAVDSGRKSKKAFPVSSQKVRRA